MARALKDSDLLELYRQMALIRRFEEKSSELYAEGKIGGFLHLYIGEEAIAVGSCRALGPDDHLLTAYRDHGWAIARGLAPGPVMAELLGKATGVSGGKGGSMHLASAAHRYWGGHAIVGGHLPLATGVGLQIRYNDLPDAVLCVLGEGTTNIGYFHESMNLAAIWKLPVIFLVENNQYGMGTEVGRASALTNIYEKGCAYGVENQQFNGQDVVETYEVMANALAYARQEGPVLLEAITYRYVGHSMGDPERYRTKAEIELWRERDPLCRIEDQMTADGRASFDDFTRIQKEAAAAVDEIVKFAEESPEPADAALWEHIFVNPIGEGERRE